MPNGRTELRALAEVALAAKQKRAKISRIFKKSGLISLGSGAWLGHRSRDVVSGIVINGSRFETEIVGFILPAFNKLEFINLTLGNTIIRCESEADTEKECEEAIACYIETYSHIKSLPDLLKYIDVLEDQGWYDIWVRYISYSRKYDFDAAIDCLDESRRVRLHSSILNQLNEIEPFVDARDREGIDRVFTIWSACSERIFGQLAQPFDAF